MDEKLHSGVAGGCRACGLSESLLPDSGLPLQGEAAQCQATLLGRVSRRKVLGSEDAPTSLGQGNIAKS